MIKKYFINFESNADRIYIVGRVKVRNVDTIQSEKSSTVHLRSSQKNRRQPLCLQKIVNAPPHHFPKKVFETLGLRVLRQQIYPENFKSLPLLVCINKLLMF
jgi:hypothetical protein